MASLIPILIRVLGSVAVPLIGKLIGQGLIPDEVQSVIFDKKKFTVSQAKKWLTRNNFKHGKVDVKPHYYRFRQHLPSEYKRFRMERIEPGVLFVLGFQK
jgi:hypothetical protein